MIRPWLRLASLAPLSFCLGGCQLLGAGGSMIGSLFSLVIYLAAIAAPILLSYYLYKKNN
ncbi:MAG TPA: hypothetical protein VE981_06410 [Planctomycetota bacterium]|nr:hypothetical protein [Planctomycetota bacterium]